MHFCQLDRITELLPGNRIKAIRGLALSEPYLQDHFPRFPVMPGVLMLECVYQAGIWLVYASEDFRYSTVALKKADQVKFYDFLQPGNQLSVTVEWKKQVADEISMVASGEINGKSALKARITLDRFNLAERQMASTAHDEYIRMSRKDEMLRLLNPLGEIRKEILRVKPVSNGKF